MNTKKYLGTIAVIGTIASLVAVLPAFASDSNGNSQGNLPNASFQGKIHSQGRSGIFPRAQKKPGVFGTVESVSGNTITITSIMGRHSASTTSATTTTTYTVDATNAVVIKDNSTSTISSIAVGDLVAVQGTITGTNVIATKINDRVNINDSALNRKGKPLGIVNNGGHVVFGTISALSGNTITITNRNNVSYTVDATNSKISKGGASSSVSDLAVGDLILVQGTVNGNSVTASNIIDRVNNNPNPENNNQKPAGFLGGVGHFFKHLFGF